MCQTERCSANAGGRTVKLQHLASTLCAVPVLVMIAGCSQQYVAYVPIDYGGTVSEPEYVKAVALLNREHLLAIQIVLWRYNEPYRVENGVVFIPRGLQQNEELLFNYTQKAAQVPLGEVLDYLGGRRSDR